MIPFMTHHQFDLLLLWYLCVVQQLGAAPVVDGVGHPTMMVGGEGLQTQIVLGQVEMITGIVAVMGILVGPQGRMEGVDVAVAEAEALSMKTEMVATRTDKILGMAQSGAQITKMGMVPNGVLITKKVIVLGEASLELKFKMLPVRKRFLVVGVQVVVVGPVVVAVAGVIRTMVVVVVVTAAVAGEEVEANLVAMLGRRATLRDGLTAVVAVVVVVAAGSWHLSQL